MRHVGLGCGVPQSIEGSAYEELVRRSWRVKQRPIQSGAMREFLIEFALEIPEGSEQAEVDRRLAAESVCAAELASTGTLYRLWRTLGQSCTLGVFRSVDKGELEKILGTLPMPLPPWLTVRVIPLVSHPNDPGSADHA